MKPCLQIHPTDSVAVAVTNLKEGEVHLGVSLKQEIPAGHKFALRPIAKGETVLKYGFSIGKASRAIEAGEHVHTHNLSSDLPSHRSYRYTPSFSSPPSRAPREFMGYRRADGTVGIRNEIRILPTVGCVNGVVSALAERFRHRLPQGVDGVYAFQHPFGCSQLGGDLENTLACLAGHALHPNAAATLVVGLGCENGSIEELKRHLGNYDPRRIRFLVAQEAEDEMAEGEAILEELLAEAAQQKRVPCRADELTVGLKCGGSDGFSGITANPLLGAFSDLLIGMGGSALLTEVPEMFGAETILMDRCRTEEVFDRTVSLIGDFKEYFLRYGEGLDENPSPGNRAGGITTLAEKSLGCVQKGGSAPVEDVIRYGERIRTKGLTLLQAPGNDLVSSGALAAAGAQLILFTTGRGTPFGCPVPTAKVSTNSALAKKKAHWIDFDAGPLLEDLSLEEGAEALMDFVLRLASGEIKTHSEDLDRSALAIFKDGVTL